MDTPEIMLNGSSGPTRKTPKPGPNLTLTDGANGQPMGTTALPATKPAALVGAAEGPGAPLEAGAVPGGEAEGESGSGLAEPSG